MWKHLPPALRMILVLTTVLALRTCFGVENDHGSEHVAVFIGASPTLRWCMLATTPHLTALTWSLVL